MVKIVQCELLPNNKRLKQLIKEFGKMWCIIKPEQNVQCFKDSTTGIFIESENKIHARWVRPEDITL